MVVQAETWKIGALKQGWRSRTPSSCKSVGPVSKSTVTHSLELQILWSYLQAEVSGLYSITLSEKMWTQHIYHMVFRTESSIRSRGYDTLSNIAGQGKGEDV